MSQAKNKVKWCLNKSKRELEQGSKHRGLIKINPSEKAKDHISCRVANQKTAKSLLFFDRNGGRYV